MKVVTLNPGFKYALEGNFEDEKLQEKLAKIPGLVFNSRESRYEGKIDAVAAACLRMGLVPPAPVQHKPFVANGDLSKIPLKEYQKEGIARLKTMVFHNSGSILADDMGLGKTRQGIVLAASFKGRNMVICPAYSRETWRDELGKLGFTSVAILEPGTTKKIKKEWEQAHARDWVVSSYALADRAFGVSFPDEPPRFLLIDEFHNLRGRKAKRTKDVREIAAQAQYKVGLTGTPQWSRVRDWWALLSILLGSTFGTGYAFDEAYCNGRLNEHGGWDNSGATNTEELKKRTSYYMVRRTKAEVAKELPKLTRQIIWSDATPEAEAAFHSALATKAPGDTSAAFQATLAGKLEAAIELAAQAKQFLLFTYLKSHAYQIAKILTEEHETSCVLITGDIPAGQRQALVRDAVSRRVGVVATIDSAGTGIDGLQKTISVGIMHALDYVPIKMAQAEGRLDRIGQSLPVTWYYLAMKNSMDSLAIKAIVNKLDQTRAIMGSEENRQLRDALSDSASIENDEKALHNLYASLE